jgi:hypothetical protein
MARWTPPNQDMLLACGFNLFVLILMIGGLR